MFVLNRVEVIEMFPPPLRPLTTSELALVSSSTIGHYDAAAQAFWHGTKDHDVSQNIEALLLHLQGAPPLAILDLGCGPGRDLATFEARGHAPVGLDGAFNFVTMARAYAGCEVWHQDLLRLELPAKRFDGIFANAVLFHVPSQELPRVLGELRQGLKARRRAVRLQSARTRSGALAGERYGSYLSWSRWHQYLTEGGFDELEHYFRPEGRPRDEQPWLASVWRKRGGA